MLTYFWNHRCIQCDLYSSILVEKKKIKRVRSKTEKKLEGGKKEFEAESLGPSSKFPPDPPSKTLVESIIKGFCSDTTPQTFIERGCAVCGRLSPADDMILMSEMSYDLAAVSPGNVG